jgi:hypothetical protein
MPGQVFHVNYWENTSTAVAPVVTSYFRPGYPAWQGGVIMGSALGGLQAKWEALRDWVRWGWTVFQRTRALDPQRRAVVLRAVDALEHAAFPLAQAAVAKTATTMGFGRPEAWTQLSRELKGSAGNAENAFRHLEACRLVRANLLLSTVTNPDLNLITELAYHGFAWKSAQNTGNGRIVGS